MKIEFIKSAKELNDYPEDKRLEVALAGRSNAGKSSFLNALAGRKVAHVSQQPGKTRLLNFFQAGEHYSLVDMPGYGFSSRSGKEQMSWREMVETYVNYRPQLQGMILIMDARRNWAPEESLLLQWLQARGLPLAVVMTKIDKMGKNELIQRKRQWDREIQEIGCKLPAFWVSALKRTGLNEVEEFVFQEWVRPALKEFW